MRLSFLYQIIVLSLCFFSCATQRPPSGGPVDTTPPEIIETDPPNKTTGFTGNTFTFRFSEYVNRQSVESNLHISPLLSQPVEFDWSGKKVDIIISERIKPQTTYVLTLGSDVTDAHNVKMGKSFTLAISSGDSIDDGYVRGTVIAQNAGGISIFAYNLNSRNADTLNPSQVLPEYVVQTGNEGMFEFKNISVGTYRFFAVRDKLKDNLYDVQSDEFGVLHQDIIVKASDTLCAPMQFQLSIEDTTRPSIQSVSAVDDRHILLKLSEAPSIYPFPMEWITITDSSTQKRVMLFSVIQVPQKPSQFHLTTEASLTSEKYFIDVDSLTDNSGNLISRLTTPLSFSGNSETDTTKPTMAASIPSNNETGFPIDSVLKVFFSDAIDSNKIIITLLDTSKARIPVTTSFESSSIITIHHSKFEYNQKYTLSIDQSSIRKKTNHKKLGDTIFSVFFTTENENEFGSLEGAVIDAQSSSQPMYVQLESVEGASKTKKILSHAGKEGKFTFEKLHQGKYSISAFADSDNNGKYDFGKPYPFKPAERFGVLKDTIRVRAQWTTKDIKITIP